MNALQCIGNGDPLNTPADTTAKSSAGSAASDRLSVARRVTWLHYGGGVLACAATTALATPLLPYLDLANIVMLFLLTVLLVALWLGRGPAVSAAFVSVACFDFFFVPPRFSFTVHDAQYVVTFAVMLAVALCIGELTARLRQQAIIASSKEERTQALYEMARELTGVSRLSEAQEVCRSFLARVVTASGRLFIADDSGKLKAVERPLENAAALDPILELAYVRGGYMHVDTTGYFPLKVAERVCGVMVVTFSTRDLLGLEEHHELLSAVASLIAIVVERLLEQERLI